MALECILYNGQHPVIDESTDRFLHHAFLVSEQRANVIQIHRIQLFGISIGHVGSSRNENIRGQTILPDYTECRYC
jgi:hypothetical protein